MTTPSPDPWAVTALVLAAFMIAGAAQAVWLSSTLARRFAQPLDGGLRLRGRRIFGANKTVRGLVVMIPATGLAFVLTHWLAASTGLGGGPWPLSTAGYLAVGLLAGTGFMAGELPNSFVKRQLDIPPGESPRRRSLALIVAMVDRLDSAAGTLAAVALVVTVPWTAAAMLLAIGPVVHGAYSVLTFELGGKARPA